MNEVRPIDPNVAQRRAANPENSVWVGASAGTGKTKVLTDRVIRLMRSQWRGKQLVPGADPGRILCLTFTKAAAAEMANRLNERLARWTVLPDSALGAKLTQLTGKSPEADVLDAARRLFARVVDTPGGIAIRTLHGFCERVLRRFPLEAGITPNFTVLDDKAAGDLLDDARRATIRAARQAPNSALGQAFARLTTTAGESTIDNLLDAIIGNRGAFQKLLARPGGADAAIAEAYRAHDLDPSVDEAGLIRAACAEGAFDRAALQAACTILSGGKKTDATCAAAIAAFLEADGAAARFAGFDAYCLGFLTKEGERRKKLPTKGCAAAAPAIAAEAERLLGVAKQRRALRLCANTAAMMRIAEDLLARYRAAKAARAALDFEDLIAETRALLGDPGVAAWVLFKLDGGLDHILIDEAQDTNAAQWEIVAALAADFFAGESAHDSAAPPRTLFAVGDVKQSIFSFQGADPQAFAAMRAHFADRVRQARQGWDPVDMRVSFRSVRAVLDVVDQVFADPEARDGLTLPDAGEAEDAIAHQAFRRGMAGLVELWPLIGDEEAEPPEAWAAPEAPQQARAAPQVRLAALIADQVADWLQRGEVLPARDRAIEPADVLILLQRRKPLLDPLVSAFKARDIPLAGADRLLLTEQLAVMDLMALGRFVLLPEDDLTLATILRSPFIDLSEDQLFALAWDRPGSLWRALGDKRGADRAFAVAYDWLYDMRQAALWQRPYEGFARALAMPCPADARSGERALLGRLGGEAHDPIDAFMALALEYEREQPASLQGFLQWVELRAAEIKRDAGGGDNNVVRIMTVHGAKGLQAPIVFLPDTALRRFEAPPLLWPQGGNDAPAVPLWAGGSENMTGIADARADAAKRAAAAESRRLLYVALTRAEDRLYISGIGDEVTPLSWYDLIRRAFDADRCDPPPQEVRDARFGGEAVLRLSDRQAVPAEPDDPPGGRAGPAVTLPGWALRRPPAEPVPSRPLTPSRPVAADPPQLSPLISRRMAPGLTRGRLVHRLLEMLPEVPAAERPAAGARLLGHYSASLGEAEREALLAEVLRLFDDADFAPLFGPQGRAEVSIAGLVGARSISGQIDRLLIEPQRILILDYKSDRPAPHSADDVAPAYLRQMGAYRAALARLYPNRAIVTALLWTEVPRLMPLPDDLVRAYAPGAEE